MKILLVEDKVFVAEYIQEVCTFFFRSKTGVHSFQWCDNLLEAIALVEDEDWDLILMDSNLGPAVDVIHNGIHLVELRRRVEDETPSLDPTYLSKSTMDKTKARQFIHDCRKVVDKMGWPALRGFVHEGTMYFGTPPKGALAYEDDMVYITILDKAVNVTIKSKAADDNRTQVVASTNKRGQLVSFCKATAQLQEHLDWLLED